jgi:hypothetical protein
MEGSAEWPDVRVDLYPESPNVRGRIPFCRVFRWTLVWKTRTAWIQNCNGRRSE